MKVVSLCDLLTYSENNKVGIGMFNIVNLEFAQAIFNASQKTGLPVMMGMPERFFQFYDAYGMAAACRKLVESSKTPIAIHLDHGKTFNGVMTALKAGFSSVMFDGSALPYEENVRQTAEIVKIAHAWGVSVEGELGYVGRVGVDELDTDGFTQPKQAEDFVERTGVDALAIAVGNQHGQYKGVPNLDFERIKEIRECVDCGLVLHGGTGISEGDFVKAIRCGISKINIHTALDVAARNFNKENFAKYDAYLDYTKGLVTAVEEVIVEHMQLFATIKRETQESEI